MVISPSASAITSRFVRTLGRGTSRKRGTHAAEETGRIARRSDPSPAAAQRAHHDGPVCCRVPTCSNEGRFRRVESPGRRESKRRQNTSSRGRARRHTARMPAGGPGSASREPPDPGALCGCTLCRKESGQRSPRPRQIGRGTLLEEDRRDCAADFFGELGRRGLRGLFRRNERLSLRPQGRKRLRKTLARRDLESRCASGHGGFGTGAGGAADPLSAGPKGARCADGRAGFRTVHSSRQRKRWSCARVDGGASGCTAMDAALHGYSRATSS